MEDKNTIDEFQELRLKYPSKTITYTLEEIFPEIEGFKYSKSVITLLYDFFLDFADKNDLEFLAYNNYPLICGCVTFKKRQNGI